MNSEKHSGATKQLATLKRRISRVIKILEFLRARTSANAEAWQEARRAGLLEECFFQAAQKIAASRARQDRRAGGVLNAIAWLVHEEIDFRASVDFKTQHLEIAVGQRPLEVNEADWVERRAVLIEELLDKIVAHCSMLAQNGPQLSEKTPKRRRGRPPKYREDAKEKARQLWNDGAKRKEVAEVLFNTPTPTRGQLNNLDSILGKRNSKHNQGISSA